MSSSESIATPTLPHLGGQVEGARQAGLAGGEQELEALVRRLCGPEAGVLPHRPQPAAVHVPLDASCVRECSRLAELLFRVEAVEVAGAVAAPHLDPGLSLTSRIALLSHAGERNPAAGRDCGPVGADGRRLVLAGRGPPGGGLRRRALGCGPALGDRRAGSQL
jgi:hypothetical protein